MASTSTYLRTAELNHLTQGAAFPSAPANLYVSLHTADPTRAGTIAEVTTTVRVAGRPSIAATNWSAVAVIAAGVLETSNTAAIDFGNSANVVASVTHFGLWDAASGGNFLEGAALPAPIAIAAGSPVAVPIGFARIQRL